MYGLPSSVACPSVCLFPCIFALYIVCLATKSVNLSASYIVHQYMGYLSTKPLRRSVSVSICFSLWRPRLKPWPIHIGFVIDIGTETFCSVLLDHCHFNRTACSISFMCHQWYITLAIDKVVKNKMSFLCHLPLTFPHFVDFVCCFVWVQNLVTHVKGGM
jgi:hypothetical protein